MKSMMPLMPLMRSRTRFRFTLLAAALAAGGVSIALLGGGPRPPSPIVDPIVVLGYNELGMHCMNEDFSEIAILPPFNTLRAQVIKRGDNPDIIEEEAIVTYTIPTNTRSFDKTNFWSFEDLLFGVSLAPDIGLTGHGLSGTMSPTASGHWEVTGIPITPNTDSGHPDPYPLALITASKDGQSGSAHVVVPVSTEISCNLCHFGPGISSATDILQDHDRLHGTTLEQQKPVLCASCHADNALGTPGVPGVPNLSSAMHGAHASRMDMVPLENKCYACHPGIRTQCQRDIHLSLNIQCIDCHGGMKAVADPGREPWIDEPRCSTCHTRPGFQFEQPGKLFKDSIGHGGVHCAACHGAPHAITPTVTAVDNQQAIALQGHPGVIDTCTVCHTVQPSQPFFHSVDDD